MDMHYDLWDVETGNYFGRLAREDEALAVVQTLLSHCGDRYVDRLSLGAESDDGSWTEPVECAALLARVEQRATTLSILRLEDNGQNGAVERIEETGERATKRPRTA